MDNPGNGSGRETSQWYIGTPNGIVLCINGMDMQNRRVDGCFYHAYSEKALVFDNWDEMLFMMEQFFDELGFPFPTLSERSFGGEKDGIMHVIKRDRVMRDEELLKKHGDLGTFIIRVQHRQNSSWQGRITWMDQNKTVYFRSVWEMIKLIEEALPPVQELDPEESEATWD